jgi:hypothetical protein
MESSKTSSFYEKHPYVARTAMALGLVGLLGAVTPNYAQQKKEEPKPKTETTQVYKPGQMQGMQGKPGAGMMQGQGMRGGMGPGMMQGMRGMPGAGIAPGMRGPGYMRNHYMHGRHMGRGMHYGQRMQQMPMFERQMRMRMRGLEYNLENMMGREMMRVRPYMERNMAELGQYMMPMMQGLRQKLDKEDLQKLRDLGQEYRKHALELREKYKPEVQKLKQDIDKLRQDQQQKRAEIMKQLQEKHKVTQDTIKIKQDQQKKAEIIKQQQEKQKK